MDRRLRTEEAATIQVLAEKASNHFEIARPMGATPLRVAPELVPRRSGNVSATGSGGGLRDQLADISGTGHRVGPPPSMGGRTFGTNQKVIKTGQA